MTPSGTGLSYRGDCDEDAQGGGELKNITAIKSFTDLQRLPHDQKSKMPEY